MERRIEKAVRRGRSGEPALYAYAELAAEPKLAVGLVHGYAEHGARYTHVMEAWAKEGISTVAIDLRGHGRAEGRRGYCDRFSDFLRDVDELGPLLDELVPNTPRVLFGHSFGGLVSATSAALRPDRWKALVLSGPYLGLKLAVPAVKRVAAKVASRVWPTLAIPTGLSGDSVTHDAARAKAYDDDPLVFSTATARWFTEAREAQERLFALAPSLELPLYVVFGAADPLADPGAAKRFVDACASQDKTWDERPGLLHEVLNEIEWQEVAADLARWMLMRGAQAETAQAAGAVL